MLKKEVFTSSAVLFLFAMNSVLISCQNRKTAVKKQNYEYTTLSKGSIKSTVASTGTLAVVSSVDVLAQMSGRIEKVYADYNNRVKKGQLLATINTDLLKLKERSAKASVDKAQAAYDLQDLTVQNDRTLFNKGFLSEFDYKSALAALRIDKAELESAEVSLEEITTEINQYAYITSPVDGIVLSREIDAGSSVTGGSVSSSTTLFTIAGNLEQMEIEAEVDELDINSIKTGQKVMFTVEAAPGVEFTGNVKEVRLVPETSDNLVYYYVIILADNKSGKLLPGMTANINFIKEEKDDILTVPSAALRFTPSTLSDAEKNRLLFAAGLPPNMTQEENNAALVRYDEQLKNKSSGKNGTENKESGLSSLMSGGGRIPGAGGPPGGGGGAPGGSKGQHQRTSQTEQNKEKQPDEAETVTRKPLWYLDENGKLAAAMVQIGISDSLKTEVSGAGFLTGKKIILKVKAE
ncbi:MAG: efflux RND transporter periplasmic adaptor subunit [Treponema sp.]